MKTYEALIKQLNEASAMAVPNYGKPQVDDGGVNLFAIEDPRVSDRINAALSHVNSEPTTDPSSRISEIKQVLSHAGLDFDHSIFSISEGDKTTEEIPLTQFGGRFGMTPEDGFVDDDGISHRTGGVKYGIKLEAIRGEDSLWTIDAKIMPMQG